jgi:hypothetical protein
MADWKTLIKEDLSPPQARSQARSKYIKPARYQKVEWDDKNSELQQEIIKIKQEQAKLDLILSSRTRGITLENKKILFKEEPKVVELKTKAAKRQVMLKKKLDSVYAEEKTMKQKQAVSQQVTAVQTRILEIKHEITEIDRFLSNPFTDKRLSSEQRKATWLKAADKKKALEKALAEAVKIWNKLTLEEKVTRRQRRT